MSFGYTYRQLHGDAHLTAVEDTIPCHNKLHSLRAAQTHITNSSMKVHQEPSSTNVGVLEYRFSKATAEKSIESWMPPNLVAFGLKFCFHVGAVPLLEQILLAFTEGFCTVCPHNAVASLKEPTPLIVRQSIRAAFEG